MIVEKTANSVLDSTDFDSIDKFCCRDCNKSTKENDYYMADDALWREFGCGLGVLCLLCLNKRIGRKFEEDDFPRNVECNWSNNFVKKIWGIK